MFLYLDHARSKDIEIIRQLNYAPLSIVLACGLKLLKFLLQHKHFGAYSIIGS